MIGYLVINDVIRVNVPTRNLPRGSEETTTNFRDSRLTRKLHIFSPERESQTLHRFAGAEEETRTSVKNLNFCLASGAPNTQFTPAV